MANHFRDVVLAACFALALCSVNLSAEELIAGQNINMVSGTEWPNGDPFLQRQNEPTIAISTRNEFHLMGGSNDYRTVDLPGLPEGKTIGDSWISSYFSNDGGGRWTSTLLPGYPQDDSLLGLASPLKLYEATADPVIRAGTHGLFYYSGIAFTRDIAPPSAGFVATYMDLNNDERKNSIGFVRTTIFDHNDDGTSFIDKPWIAVDKPRTGAQPVTLNVNTVDGGVIPQDLECGNVYAAYARIQGDGSAAIRSQIMFTRSEDCAGTFSEPIQLSLPNTINQGAAVAIEPVSGRIQVAWRQFENATLDCTYKASFWRTNPEAWPVEQVELAGMILRKGNGSQVVVETADADDDHDTEAYDEFDFSDDADRPSGVLRQLLAAWLNILSGSDPGIIRSELAEAEAWLVTNPLGTHPKSDVKRRGNDLRKILRDYNKGKTGPGKCDALRGNDTNGLLSGLNPNAIMVVTSTDFGATFSTPVAATDLTYFPFEQGTTEFSFRTTGYPTMTFDGEGRSYIAYSTRGLAIPDADPVGGDARIVVTTSMDGLYWTPAQAIDEPSVPGHQFMPAIEFSRGKVFLLYYDLREDVSGVFGRFIVDLPVDLTTPRHSADVRVAQADADEVPVFTDYSVLDVGPIRPSTQGSRYPFLMLDNAGLPFSQQMLYNPPNLPMFKGGTVPFFGDYIDLAALRFIKDELGNWEFDIDPARGVPVVHAVWTDNRDVVGPLDGNWTSYVPPGLPGDLLNRDSIFDLGPDENVPDCTPDAFDRTKMRNQNIYTTRLTQGLSLAVPGNNRPLSTTLQRVFVAFLQNSTDEDKHFRLRILNQPANGSASFDQFSLVTERVEFVAGNSSVSRSIYVTSTEVAASVDISVVEFDNVSGIPVTDGLAALTRINPDPSAPVPNDANIINEEIYTPAIFNPAIFNPAIFNVALGTGDIGIFNPAIFNPAIFNSPEQDGFVVAVLMQLALLNPAIFNPAIFNPAIFNPAIFNPAIFNPAIFNTTLVETSVVVENTGNTTAAYSLNLDFDNPPGGFLFQVMIYQTYLVPSVDGCDLTENVVQEQLVNDLLPNVNGSLLSPDSTSFHVAPGDNVVVTLRIIPDPTAPGDPTTIDTLEKLNLSASVVPQAVDTAGLDNGETEPTAVVILSPALAASPLVIVTGPLPSGVVGAPYPSATTLSTSGGSGDSPVVWSIAPGSVPPPGLSLTAGGQIVGTPTTQGTFNFAVRANDTDQVAEQSLSITVIAAPPPLVPMVSQNSAFGTDTITFDPVTGIKWLDVTLSTAFSYDQILGELGPGGVFEDFRLGTSAEVLTFWQNAGVDTGVGFLQVFTTENFLPIVDLMGFVGVTGLNTGNLGAGNFFDFTAGHIESGPGGVGNVNVATLSSDPVPTVTGRPDIGVVPSNNSNNQHGSWLIRTTSINSVTLNTTTLTINGPLASYSASIGNFTGGDLSIAALRAWIDQPGASKAAGGLQLNCGATGVLPAGLCNINFSLGANNASSGIGTLIAGPATARFELTLGGILLDTFLVPITLQ